MPSISLTTATPTTIRVPSCILSQASSEENTTIASSSITTPAHSSRSRSPPSVIPSSPQLSHISTSVPIQDEITRLALTSASPSHAGGTRRRRRRKTNTKAGEILDEDITGPTFFFRNLSLVQSDLTKDLKMKQHEQVGDAERIIRAQCIFFSAMVFRLIQHKTYIAARPCIGVIGCGPIGRLIIESLLEMGWPPQSLLICTRDVAKVKDFRAKGVTCTERHEAWHPLDGKGGIPLIFLAISPVHLRELTEQLEGGIVEKEQLIISTLVGVTLERLCKVLEHDLLLRTTIDVRRFPLPWSSAKYMTAESPASATTNTASSATLIVEGEDESFYHAARQMRLAPGGVQRVRTVLTAFGERQHLGETEARSIVDECLFGLEKEEKEGELPMSPAAAAGAGAAGHPAKGESGTRQKPTSSITSPSKRKSTNTSSTSRAKSYIGQEQFEQLDAYIRRQVLPTFSRVFNNSANVLPALVMAGSLKTIENLGKEEDNTSEPSLTVPPTDVQCIRYLGMGEGMEEEEEDDDDEQQRSLP